MLVSIMTCPLFHHLDSLLALVILVDHVDCLLHIAQN